MISDYMQAALRRATFHQLEDGSFVGEIPGFDGVWSQGQTLEEARAELPEVLEGWIVLGLRLGHDLPIVDGINLTPALETA
jgi:predicted RNase H-like HicB family nuclease